MKNFASVKAFLIEKAYRNHPNLVRFKSQEEFTIEENNLVIFWYNVPLPNGTQTTKVEVYYGSSL